MDDNQLDRLFQQELQEYQASSQGAEANWGRLRRRMVARRRAGGWWIWLIGLLLLGGGATMALTLTIGPWETGPVAGQTPSPPLRLKDQSTLSQRLSMPLANALLSGAKAGTSPALPSPHSSEQPWGNPAPKSSSLPNLRGAASKRVPTASSLRSEDAAVPSDSMPAVSTLAAVDSLTDRPYLGLKASWKDPRIEPLALPSDHRPWRWLPRVGLSFGWQQSRPTSELIQPWPLGIRAVLVEKGPFALEAGLYRDRYRVGTDFRSQGLLSPRAVEADFELGIPPVLSNGPSPDTQVIRQLRIDAPGLVLPLGLSFSPHLSSRWQPFVQAGVLLRYQFEPSITGEYRYVVQTDSNRFSPATPAEGIVPVVVNVPDTDAYRGWQVSGWQVAAGVRLRLHRHLSAQLEGYYQSRRAFDLPEQPPFQTIGMRATFWWER